MAYSQKYALVQFLEPVEVGSVFSMEEWPQHITIADVFAANLDQGLIDNLKSFLASERVLEVIAGNESKLGDDNNPTQVVLIKNSTELQSLHNKLIDFLELHGAVFNSPEFTRNGFLPHSSYKNIPYIKQGNRIQINELSLIDLFVGENWKMRKVLKSFKMRG